MCHDEIREYACGHYTQIVTHLCRQEGRINEPCLSYIPNREPILTMINTCCSNECCRHFEAPCFDDITALETHLAYMRRYPEQHGPLQIEDKEDDIRRARAMCTRVHRHHEGCRVEREDLYGEEPPAGPWLDGGMATYLGCRPDRDRWNRRSRLRGCPAWMR